MITLLRTARLGCTTAGLYPLAPVAAQRASSDFKVEASAEVDFTTTRSDLKLHLDLHYSGASAARVDLSKLWWKVDGVSWQRCRHGKQTDKNSLIFNLPAGQSRSMDLLCQDIPRPYEKVEVRFHTAGTGSLGVVSLEFKGIAQPL